MKPSAPIAIALRRRIFKADRDTSASALPTTVSHVNRVRSEPVFHGGKKQFVKIAAMNGKMLVTITREAPAGFGEYELTVPVEETKFAGFNAACHQARFETQLG